MCGRGLTHAEDHAAEAQRLAATDRGERDGYAVEQRLLRPDGGTVWVALASVVRSEFGEPLHRIAQVQDITARRTADDEVRRYADQLIRMDAEAPLGAVAPAGDPEELAVRRVLRLAREHLGTELAFLGRFDGEDLVFAGLDGDADAFGLAEGDAIPLAGSFCARLADGRIGAAVPDAAAEPQVARLAVTREAGIGAYAGAILREPDGTPVGSLCTLSRDARPEVTEADARSLRLLTAVLQRELADQRRRRAQAEHSGVRALMAALQARDHYTSEHSATVVRLATAVARRLGLTEREVHAVGQVALLHDIGKVGIPDSVLQKQGPLSEVEWALMRQHTLIGERIIAGIDSLAHLAPALRSEHERWDGGGYPDGLAGADIPVCARIILACDAFDAMTTDRPYRPAMDGARARAELRANAGTQFDPDVVEALLAEVGEA